VPDNGSSINKISSILPRIREKNSRNPPGLSGSGLNDYTDNSLISYNNKYRYVSESPSKNSPSNKFKKQFLLKNSGVLIPSS
jgi:hypothetical protein